MSSAPYTRVIMKTRRKIQGSFAELLAERGSMKDITVKDLAERAEITRGTFYNYYNNIYEVRAELQNELERKLFVDYDSLNTTLDMEQCIDKVFLFFKENESLYRQLLSASASTEFLNQLENKICQYVLKIMDKKKLDDIDVKTELLFTTNGAMAIVRRYFRNETTLSLDEIRDYLKNKLKEIGF